MLIKLFKHEMRATAKTFMWLYIAFAAIAVVSAVLAPWSPLGIGSGFYSPGGISNMTDTIPPALQMIMFILYILAVAAMSIVTIVVIILRFYRNLLGDEGYLMMTLPVSREANILSKLLAAVIWFISTMVIIFLSVLLFIAVSGYFSEMVEAVREQLALIGAPMGRWIVMFVLSVIVSSASGILMLYAAMAIGPNLLKNRLGGSVLAFIIIYIASQFITTFIMIAWGSTYTNSFFTANQANQANDFGMPVIISVVDTAFASSIVTYAIIGVCCWFLTRYMLVKKLNLA